LLPFKLRLFQVIIEAILPILGYFYWNWSFYFILLFYFLDYLVSSVFLLKKIDLIQKNSVNQAEINAFQKYSSLIVIALIIIMGYFLLRQVNEKFDFVQETLNFLLVKEFGIPQGILLLPLIYLAGYVNFKNFFIVPKKYLVIKKADLFSSYFIGNLICLGLLVSFFGLTFFVQFNELTSVLILVALASAYSLFYKRI
jgi:hypothetical protein